MWSYAAILSIMLSAASLAQAQAQHHAAHDHSALHDAELAIADGKRFATDQPLRTGMARIRTAVTSLAQPDAGHSRAQAIEQANAIERHIDFLIANCRLEPQADAVLHGIISQLLAATGKLREAPEDAAPIAQLQAALQAYDNRFDTAQTTD